MQNRTDNSSSKQECELLRMCPETAEGHGRRGWIALEDGPTGRFPGGLGNPGAGSYNTGLQ